MEHNKDIKTPPPMSKDLPYNEWKHEIKVWRSFTNLDKTKLGPALFLSLQGSARDAAHEVSVEDLSKENGIEILLKKLDELYLKDTDNAVFEAYDRFERYQRPEGMNIIEYINAFERLYQKAKHYKLELPDGVLAYRLLRSANLSDTHEQLARATLTALTYVNMQTQLKKIFNSENSSTSNQASAQHIKIEPTYVSQHQSEEETYYVQRGNRGSRYSQRRGGYASRRGRGRQYSNYRYTSGLSGASVEEESKSAAKSPVNINQRRLNLLDSYGNVSLCNICGSKFHWASKCPDSYEAQGAAALPSKDEAAKEVLITLYTGFNQNNLDNDEVSNIFLGETLNFAIVDSGCSRTVCGETWLECYIDTLSNREKAEVKQEDGNTYFKFGDGVKIKSIMRTIFPATIAGKNIMISTDVIPSKIPLLLSKDSMKRASMKINFADDTAFLFGKQMKLQVASGGHYIIPLGQYHENEEIAGENFVLICSRLKKASSEEKHRMARKIHRQFGHPKSKKLKSLCSKAGIEDCEFMDLFDYIELECEICQKYKRAPLRPIVGFNMANEFNDVVAIDLKEWNHTPTIWFCHMIDLATRYSAAAVIHKKDKSTIISKIMTHWISKFGSPKQFHSDNGGEFNNEDFRSMAENFNIRITTTAAGSPWSNGCNERHNGIIGETVSKVLSDTKCSLEIALSWAIAAKNSLENCNGFSPNQLVFGKNPNYPSVLYDKVPALEASTSSETVRTNLNALHKAREAFIQKESSEKLRRALLHQVRPTGEQFGNGDRVFYKRLDGNKWCGPGTVIGHENKQILVRHGGVYYRCHACNVMKAGQDNNISTEKGEPKTNFPESRENTLQIQNDKRCYTYDDSDIEDTNDEPTANNVEEEDSVNNGNTVQDASNARVDTEVIKEATMLPKSKSRISYISKNAEDWKDATVLGRAGKATGKYRYFVNVLDDGEENAKCLNWQEVDDWKEIESHETYLCMEEMEKAKLSELQNWQSNNVYTSVLDSGQKCVSCRWIISEKQNPDGLPYVKARLVARGFEEDTSDIQTDSPTCGKESFRIVLSIAAAYKWKCNSIDIKAAFLQGGPLQRDVYLRPPPEADEDKRLWHLKTCVYGLNDASRYWYLRTREVLFGLGMKASKYDKSIFYYYDNGSLSGIISCHVDDFFWCGNVNFKKTVIHELRKVFMFGTEQSGMFKYIGLHIMQQSDGRIILHQNSQIDALETSVISHERLAQSDSNLNDREIGVFRKICGQLNWFVSQSRPDIAFDSCDLSCSIKNATVKDLVKANKVVRKTKSERVSIKFPPLDLATCTIVVYSDASYGNLPDGSSQGGYIIMLKDRRGLCIPLSWSSTKIKRITRSTLASECMALQEGVDAAFLLSSILSELLYEGSKTIKILARTDSKGLQNAIYSTKAVQDKRLRVDIARLRQLVERNELSQVEWVDNTSQIADCLTKKTASTRVLLNALHNSVL